MELKDVAGIGETSLKLLNGMGIKTVKELVRNYPYRFDRLARRNLDDVSHHNDMIIDGVVESVPVVNFFKRGMNRLTFSMMTQNRVVKVIIFNRAFMKRNIKPGSFVTVIGKYNPRTQTLTAINILLSKLPDKIQIIPVYHHPKGITSKQMRCFINNALKSEVIENNVPEKIIQTYGFMSENEALRIIHNPEEESSLKRAIKTLKYEELFTYMLRLKKIKDKNKLRNALFKKDVNEKQVNDFIRTLPFALTDDQKKVILEAIADLKSDFRMNRLLQGDVGSGKTIVAFVLAYAAFTAGYQVALMAPTEILAIQHYHNALKIFSGTDFKVGLLTGKMSVKEKRVVYDGLANNETSFLIGTHALISEGVSWNNLGLVITDEQHRFGVNQRSVLANKANAIDVLSMSATPIPRTYALTIYGDTDISGIKSMPSGRLPVKTYIKRSDELKDVLAMIYMALKNGNQAYVIAPMIDDDEEESDYASVNDLKHKFELAFKNYKVGVLHGKMKKEEKDTIMNEYVSNEINILISTTVVEVGVDVKNATVMVIFDADRFGLSTLHQLRGRVGRNSLQSYCYLISDKDAERLKIMEQTSDGYEISEADFKLRGQGDLFGNRQSGALQFKLSDVKKDYDLLVKVKRDVDSL